jgi:hypothetical protein
MTYDWDTTFDPTDFQIKLFGGRFHAEVHGQLWIPDQPPSSEVTIEQAAFAVCGSGVNFLARPRLVNPRKDYRIRCFDPQAKLLEFIDQPPERV